MSTVVGLKTNEGVWIGADSRASTEEGEIRPFVANKVFYNGEYLIGFIGSVRGGQVVRPEYFKPPKNVYDWPDALIAQCDKKGCLGHSDQQTNIMLCNYIIGDKRDNKMYEILVDFQMNEIDDYTAVGSGSYYAFGSFFTTEELNIKDGHERVELALKTAAKFDSATGGPLKIMKLE